MIVACDVDGVIAALHVEWLRRYNAEFNDRLTPDDLTTWNVHEHVKPECGTAVYRYLTEPDLYDAVLPVPGAQDGVAALRRLGHDVTFVTACTYGMVDQKARWLVRHSFCQDRNGRGLPHDLIVANRKDVIAADLLIEDNAATVRAWVEQTGRRAVLLDRPYNRSLDAELPSMFWSYAHRALDWDELLTHVEALGQ